MTPDVLDSPIRARYVGREYPQGPAIGAPVDVVATVGDGIYIDPLDGSGYYFVHYTDVETTE